MVLSKLTYKIYGINIFGKLVDWQNRCVQWHSKLDGIAIKFKYYETYYPCFSCHEDTTGHEPKVWPRAKFGAKVILCGVCGTGLTINEYLRSNITSPNCRTILNPDGSW